jgi:hypothetical protein
MQFGGSNCQRITRDRVFAVDSAVYFTLSESLAHSVYRIALAERVSLPKASVPAGEVQGGENRCTGDTLDDIVHPCHLKTHVSRNLVQSAVIHT